MESIYKDIKGRLSLSYLIHLVEQVIEDVDKLPGAQTLENMYQIINRTADIQHYDDLFRQRLHDNPLNTVNHFYTFYEHCISLLAHVADRIVEKGREEVEGLESLSTVKKIEDFLLECHQLLVTVEGMSEYVESLFHTVKVICYVLKGIFSSPYPFQKEPRFTNLSSPLWEKLTETSFKRFVKEYTDKTCGNCHCKLKGLQNFAILDCCTHLFCLPCAFEKFNRPSDEGRECPVCHKHVEEFTSKYHYGMFKRGEHFKSLAWGVLNTFKWGLTRPTKPQE